MSTNLTQAAGRPLAAITAMLVALTLFTGLLAPAANAASAQASANPAATSVTSAKLAPAAPAVGRAPNGTWTWWGYVLNRSETNMLANVSLWNAVSGVKGTRLIPYSDAILRIMAATWVLTARNARSMGQCFALNYAGTGIIANCR